MHAERREQHQELVETGPALLLVTLLTVAVATRGPGPAAVCVEPRCASLSSPLLLAGGCRASLLCFCGPSSPLPRPCHQVAEFQATPARTGVYLLPQT